MYTEERQQEIVRLIQQNTRQSVQDLSRQLNVSDSTIRRDLQELEKRGLIKRTHGGAINTTVWDLSRITRTRRSNASRKKR